MNFKVYKIGILSVGLLCLFTLCSKEGFSQMFMIGVGGSFYSDFVFISPHVASEEGTSLRNEFGGSVFSVSAEMKYNLYEFNTDWALSVASSPSFGTMIYVRDEDISEDSFGNLRLPLYAQIDFGNLSTFSSMKNMGVGIGLGYEFDVYNLFGGSNTIPVGTFAARLGIRYFRSETPREIAIKFGFPKTRSQEYTYYDHYSNEEVTKQIDQKITSIQLSWVLYLNY